MDEDKSQKVRLKDVLSGIRGKLDKKTAKSLKLIKLSSKPDIKYNIREA